MAQGKVIGGGSSINGQQMQRGFAEDFDSWSSLSATTNGLMPRYCPILENQNTIFDIRDDFHGTEGPMPVRRRQSGPWPDIQKAFRAACVHAGFGTTEDTNGANPSGVGVSPSNNLDGVRMSAAITHLNPMRHCSKPYREGRGFRQEGLNGGFKGCWRGSRKRR